MADSILNNILDQETNRIKGSFQGDPLFAIIEIIRSLDYQSFTLGHNLRPTDLSLLGKYQYGWSLAFRIFYNELSLTDNVPLYHTTKQNETWANSIIQHAGSIQTCRQLLDLVKASLMALTQPSEKSFCFQSEFEYDIEQYEKYSLAFVHKLKENILLFRIKSMSSELPKIRKELEKIVEVTHDHFISYRATEKFDKFYTEFAYLYTMTTKVLDDFSEDDTFGPFTYGNLLDFAFDIVKAGLMHRDCCMALAEKTKHQVYLRDLLTHAFSIDKFTKVYAQYIDGHPDDARQLLSCFVIDKENFQHHLDYPKAVPAPFFKLGNDTVLQSSIGCLENPIFFLNRELKNRYPKDYFNAVNRREIRFRNQLYSLFDQENIIKIHENIVLKFGSKILTDIDAILFDKETKTLGLFQLKWQDTFSTNFRERFSRITNLVPKSIEWIDRVQGWLSQVDPKNALETLKIPGETKINTCHLFIIARNHVHFTNVPLDERAIWASWHQIIEARAMVKTISGSSPISAFAANLKAFSPENRRHAGEFVTISDHSFRFAEYEISVKAK